MEKITTNQELEQARAAERPALAGAAIGRAVFKRAATDFVVEEDLGFEPDGDGAHLLLAIRQVHWNSAAVARWLARQFHCASRDVGYSGHKDRHAVTVQHFTVPLAKATPDPESLDWPEGLSCVHVARHRQKLRRGAHRGNRFVIRLHDIDADPAAVDDRLQAIASRGFANYFGSQRFGRDGANAARGRQLLESKSFRRTRGAAESIEVSALRSELFNMVLAARVRDGTCLEVLPGDALMLEGTRSFFTADEADAALDGRVAKGDVAPTGPLWGIADRHVADALLVRERAVLFARSDDLALLEARGFRMERRALRALARNFAWSWSGPGTLELRFGLAAGSYATSLVEELFCIMPDPPAAG